MERLLYFLPKKPQPVWVRYATTTVVMAFCIAVQIGLENQTGFVGLFFLLPGIFAAGLMFDRGASLYATALGTAFAYFSISPTAPFPGYVAPCMLFAGTGAVVGLVAEGLRTEMEKVVRAEKAKTVLLMELAHRTKNNLAMLSAMMRLQAKHPDVTCVCRKPRPLDLMRESLNVGRDGRADLPVFELGCLALQAQVAA